VRSRRRAGSAPGLWMGSEVEEECRRRAGSNDVRPFIQAPPRYACGLRYHTHMMERGCIFKDFFISLINYLMRPEALVQCICLEGILSWT
jgi:hypothetical protein